jgi:DNA-binding NarL/FixJ family response regulator
VLRSLGEGFRIIQADSGERAWEILLLEPSIGAVLSDLSMPGVDGFELLGRVRGSMLSRVQGLPFVVLSGAVDQVHRDRAMSLGADRFVVKGDDFDELRIWLRGQLDGHTVAHDDAVRAHEPALASVEATPLQVASSSPVVPMTQGVATPRLVPEDPLQSWFQAAFARISPTPAAPAVLYRVSAPKMPDLTARLRAGIRSADALYLDGLDAGWLCACGPYSQTVRLGLRFALLAAGRQAGAPLDGPRIALCMQPVDPSRTLGALASLTRTAPSIASPKGPSIRALPGLWGPGWQCELPWEAVRLLST